MLCFDIETGKLPDDELRKMLPEFGPDSAVKRPPEKFDPESVRLGNLKDEKKIAEKLDAARAAHAAALKNYSRDVEHAREQHWQNFKERAALSPLTGRVLAVGVMSEQAQSIQHVGSLGEVTLLAWCWEIFEHPPFGHPPKETKVGHNIHNFDLPFLVRRSWLLGVEIPDWLMDDRGYWHPSFVDLMRVWQCGNRQEYVKLDVLAKAFGIQGKPEGIDGGDFDRLYHGTPEERHQALDYLKHDLDMTWHVAEAMGVL